MVQHWNIFGPFPGDLNDEFRMIPMIDNRSDTKRPLRPKFAVASKVNIEFGLNMH
jgi:hypothetical protein